MLRQSKTWLNLILIFLLPGCYNIEVENLNEPTLSHFTREPEMLETLAGTLFRDIHNAMQEYNSPALAMSTMADQNTCSWGTAGMRDLSNEPRQGWNNSIYYSYYSIIGTFWKNCYSVISTANDVENVLVKQELSDFFNDGEKAKLKSWCSFIKGISHGYLGLTFDRANIVRGDVLTDSLGFVSWENMIDISLDFLDEAIETANANTFVIPAEWMGGESYSNVELAELANSFAARILVYSSRNKNYNDKIDWNRVLKYATNGIQKNLQPVLGDAYGFYDMFTVYARYPGWAKIDNGIINLLDPNYPSYWPQRDLTDWLNSNQNPGFAQSEDARLESDLTYMPSNFQPSRGLYHLSNYKHKRFDYVFSEYWHGSKAKPSMLVWENDLLIAEANLRLGNAAKTLFILNDPNGSRKVRGKLDDVNTTDFDKLLWTIFYERDIELINTGMGIAYFDMRRRDNLQRGTILHFPVPAGELQTMNLEVYTIGLVNWSGGSNIGQNPINGGFPDGENVSMGSWTGLDGITVPPGIVP